MIVCGDDALAHRLAAELRKLYNETVTLVVPGSDDESDQPETVRHRASVLLGRISFGVRRPAAGVGGAPSDGQPAGRDGGPDRDGAAADRIVTAPHLTEDVLAAAGVQQAAALALVHDDDETNIRAALAARRLNPRLRLVIRLYNRRLGQHLADLLDQAAALALPVRETTGPPGAPTPAWHVPPTTVLSDAATAAPALAASAVAGSSKIVQAGGLLLRAAEVTPGQGDEQERGLCTLALLSSTTTDPAGAEGAEDSGPAGPLMLPDRESVAAAPTSGRVVLTTVSYSGPAPGVRRGLPLGWLLSKRLRWSFAGLVAAVFGLAVASVLFNGQRPLTATYYTLLDLFAINDPAVNQPVAQQILQLLSGLVGLLLLPVLTAAVLEALGSFRTGPVARRPPRGLSDHVVLLGLGKIGTRVLLELRRLDIPVVCVEADPEARGVPVARRLRVPVVLGDVTQEGVLEAAKIHRARSLLALTSLDTTNLEAALAARAFRPELRTVLRLYDDDFATAVYRTLRIAHPQALTRSRSVSHLAAPAFAAAMMGRQILGAIPVERRVLLFAAVDVAGHPLLEGRTIREVFRPGKWRVLALDRSAPGERLPDLAFTPQPYDSGAPDLVWDLDPDRVLRPDDRVVLAATRQGLAELLGRRHGRP